MEVKIKTLTPLWTGGIDAGKCDRIHETGILGSLRWWMEVLVRGMGGNVCDPTEQKCSAKNGLCPVCQLFGAEGQKRRFRLSVNEKKLDWQPNVPLRITPPDRTRGWFLNPGWLGTLTLNLQGDSATLVELHILLRFIETWGSIGARPQLGYGAFRIIDIKNPPPEACYAIYGDPPPSDQPDLRTFTFFKLRFTPKTETWWHMVPGIKELRTKRDSWTELEQLAKQGMVPTTPALKNYLRYHQQWSSPALPHWLFGTIRQGDDRIRSKVAFSWAYRLDNSDEWEIRGWMYLPQSRDSRVWQREIWDKFKENLEQPQTWLSALGLQATDYRAARVIISPTELPWKVYTISEMQTFLATALAGEQP
jgi:CRISPR-associated protein Cmr1